MSASILNLASDYVQGAHPNILKKLFELNDTKSKGYGADAFTASAKGKILAACGLTDGDVYFFSGGTQTNKTVISTMLRPYQGVICADTGHPNCHEAGAIENGGHKVIALPAAMGKLKAEAVDSLMGSFYADDNNAHMVQPGMVYISQPTELGTLYSHQELSALAAVCKKHGLPLYCDGARLIYGLESPVNDVSLTQLAELCDVFYIGGAKCGTLFGEAVVFKPGFMPAGFFTMTKLHGAMLAKGFVLGAQFDAMFTDDLYREIGRTAAGGAAAFQRILKENGFPLLFESPTNQIFVIVDNALLPEFDKRFVYSYWEPHGERETVIRFCSSWSTTEQDVLDFEERIKEIAALRG